MSGHGRVALVTGSGRGIGRAVALRLAGVGHDVALCAREADELAVVADEVRATGRRAHAAVLDIADPEATAAFATEVEAALGPIEVLINNAGVIHLPDRLDSAAAGLWDATMNVNARGAYLLCAALLPGMLERNRGRVVNVASTAGLRGLRERLAYSASKHALVGLTRALALEMNAPGVTVNAVCPGAVVTRMTMGSRPNDDRTGWLSPDDVARTVTHLASDDAGHVNGAIIELRDRG